MIPPEDAPLAGFSCEGNTLSDSDRKPEEQNCRRASLFRWAIRLEWFTILWNVLEGVVAVGAGILSGSTALVAFGVDSSIEVISAVALNWRLKTAGANATAEEHGSAERKSLYLVATTFVLLSGYIAVKSSLALIHRDEPDSSFVGLVLSIVSLILMPVLAYSKSRLGRKLGSKALEADAVETWICSYLSLSLLAGLALNAALGWWWADAAGALAMLPVILWQAWETFEEAGEAAA